MKSFSFQEVCNSRPYGINVPEYPRVIAVVGQLDRPVLFDGQNVPVVMTSSHVLSIDESGIRLRQVS
jgi:hypothetical protein